MVSFSHLPHKSGFQNLREVKQGNNWQTIGNDGEEDGLDIKLQRRKEESIVFL
jgi:hypothetical protein